MVHIYVKGSLHRSLPDFVHRLKTQELDEIDTFFASSLLCFIIVKVRFQNGKNIIEIEDNGPGLPKENRDRLTEPYVTTRAGGTGLGLAIVSKIMEDHVGEFMLSDRSGGGALAVLRFPSAKPHEFNDGVNEIDAGS